MASLWRGVIREYADRLPMLEGAPVVTLQEGGTPLIPAEHLSELDRGERLREVRGAQPDGVVQGPRHDGGDLDGGQERRQGGDLRVDRQHQCQRRGLRHQGGHDLRGARPRRQDRHGQAQPGHRARRDAPAGRRQLRRLPHPGAQARRVLPGRAGQLGQPGAHRGAEDGRVRGRRRARRRPRHPLPAGRQRRQHHGLLEGLPRVPPRQRAARSRRRKLPQMWGFQAAGAAPIVLGHPVDDPDTIATAIRIGNPASWKQAEAARDESGGRIESVTDEQILAAHRILSRPRGHLRRARLGGLGRRSAAGRTRPARCRAGATIVCTVTGHGLKDPQWALQATPTAPTSRRRGCQVDAFTAAQALGLQD